MASPQVQSLFDAVQTRRSIYKINNSSPIPDSRIQEIVEGAIKHSPSPFNVQSSRAVIFLGSDHVKLWDLGDAALKALLPPPAYQQLAPKVAQFKEGHGTVAFFEDQAALKAMGEKNPAVAGMMPQWSEHASGMAQFVVWTALSLEGIGCSLQHYNFDPSFVANVKKTWDLPETWDLKSQLVFGAPVNDGFVRDRERTFLPLEGRVKVFHG